MCACIAMMADIDFKAIDKEAVIHLIRAEEEGRSTNRRELRWFECYSHGVKMYHLTSVDEADYIARFEASKRGEFSLAA